MLLLVYRDENKEAHSAAEAAVAEAGLGHKDKVGFRNARRFNPAQYEPCDGCLVVGNWPEVVEAYRGRVKFRQVDLEAVVMDQARPGPTDAQGPEAEGDTPDADEPEVKDSEPEEETPPAEDDVPDPPADEKPEEETPAKDPEPKAEKPKAAGKGKDKPKK